MNKLRRLLGLHVHSWGLWDKVGKKVYRDDLGRVQDYDLLMERTCSECGMIERGKF